jgi:hypothetical protein
LIDKIVSKFKLEQINEYSFYKKTGEITNGEIKKIKKNVRNLIKYVSYNEDMVNEININNFDNGILESLKEIN